MAFTLFDFIYLLGSLGLFLFGMKIMSEGIQKAAGDRMRQILAAMTSRRVLGLLTGVLVTALVQSSSATTLMVVSFVNAGLLQLGQAISVIMGANIGTTVTAWVITLFGFKIDISTFAIPLFAISIPLIYTKREQLNSLGEFLVGFSLLFLGLQFLKDSMPDLQSHPEALEFLRGYTDMGFASILIFLLIGTIMTLLVQSSSATVAITLIMCSKGWIPFEIATAMILGENIGTTITANLAALGANINAKRAALSHLLFNVFGVLLVLIFFYPFTNMIANWLMNMGIGDPRELYEYTSRLSQVYDPASMSAISSTETLADPSLAAIQAQIGSLAAVVSVGLALFHTTFNMLNAFVMIWFVPVYVKICQRAIPMKKSKKGDTEQTHLRYIRAGILPTGEIGLLQVQQELAEYASRVSQMMSYCEGMLKTDNPVELKKLYNKCEQEEDISDAVEVEIADYLNKISHTELGKESQSDILVYYRVATEIESVADAAVGIAREINRYLQLGKSYTDMVRNNLLQIHSIATETALKMAELLRRNKLSESDARESYTLEKQLNDLRTLLKAQNMENVRTQKYDYPESVSYMDLVGYYEQLGDYVLNVVQAATKG